MKRWRFVVSTAVVLAALAALLSIPLPTHVYSSLVVQPRDVEGVVVKVTGVLEGLGEGVEPGAWVEQGQVLARLSNHELEAAILELEGEKELYAERYKALEVMSRTRDDRERSEVRGEIASLRKSLESIESQLAVQREDFERLTLRAPRAGVIIPPDLVPEPKDIDEQLPGWWGSPLEPKNIGATLEQGTKFCSICDPSKLEARLLVEQDNSGDVWEGQPVKVMLNQSSQFTYSTVIDGDERGKEVPVSPSQLSSLTGGPLPTQMDSQGVPRPLTPHYYFFAPLSQDHIPLRVGMVGTAKISIPDRTIAQRLYRYAARTFNFDL